MTLIYRCATVRSSCDGVVKLAVPSSRCESCPGYCVRYRIADDLELTGDYPVGTEVKLEVSYTALVAATAVVFGLPVVGLTIPLVLVNDASIALFSMAVCIAFSIVLFRVGSISKLLKPKISEIVSADSESDG